MSPENRPVTPTSSPALEPVRVLDVRGMNCPVPIVRARMTLKEMAPGQVIHVLATDPHSVLDFKAFAIRTGHELLDVVEGAGLFEFWMRCRPSTPAENEV